MMSPTAQQEAIYQHVASGQGHLIVSALAGTGKTTTACEAVKRTSGKTGFVAFNKHIATELQSRLGSAARACTMHSLGLSALKNAMGAVEVDADKPRKLLQKLRPSWFWVGPKGGTRFSDEAHAVLKLASLCKYTLTDPSSPEDLTTLIDHFGVETPPRRTEAIKGLTREVEAAGGVIGYSSQVRKVEIAAPAEHLNRLAGKLEPLQEDAIAVLAGEAIALSPHIAELLAECQADTKHVDFDDMIWLPVRLNLNVDSFDLLIVDEAQDLNRAQQELARLASRSGRMVPIGDARQSLYSFAGADPEAMNRLSASLSNGSPCSRLPLTVTWRCPISHVRLAQILVPELEASPTAIEGAIENVEPEALHRLVAPGDLVISRRNAPLISQALKLAIAGIPILVRGRDLGAGLIDMIETLRPDSPRHLLDELRIYEDREREKLEKRDASDNQFEALADRVGCLRELTLASSTLSELRERIRTLFGDDSKDATGKVVLSSVHRAKGLEADRVAIIDTESMPLIRPCRSCRGKGCERCGNRGTRAKPWEIQTEKNLAYVAVTRSKRDLIFAGPTPAFFDASF